MASSESPEDGLSAMHHALKAARRRYVLQIIANTGKEEYDVRQLAKRVTAIEKDIPRENATGEPYRNVYIALKDTHLPCLADTGIICYDSDRKRVTQDRRLWFAVLLLRLNRTTYQTLQGNLQLSG